MLIAGIIILIFSFFTIFVVAQIFFMRHTKRMFWRAFIPLVLRKSLLPDDKVWLDSFDVTEEYTAMSLVGSFMLLPIIVVSSMGFINIF